MRALLAGLTLILAATTNASADWSGRIVSGEAPRWWKGGKDQPYILSAASPSSLGIWGYGDVEVRLKSPSGFSQIIQMTGTYERAASIDISSSSNDMFRFYNRTDDDRVGRVYVQQQSAEAGTVMVISINGKYGVDVRPGTSGGTGPLTIEFTQQ